MIAVGAIVAGVHYPALSANARCFDDEYYLMDNPLVQNPGWSSARVLLTEVIKPSTVQGYYHPLGTLSIMLDYAMGGRGENHRVINRSALILHTTSAMLVVLLAYLLFGEPWAAGLVGLLFGVHPLTVETIVWLGQRKALLAGTLSLASLVFYVAYARRCRWGWLVASLAAYALALMSKPTATPLPLLMLLLDYWPLGRLTRRAVLEKTPFLVVGVGSTVLTVVSHASSSSVAMAGRSDPLTLVAMVGAKLGFYVSKVVWPATLTPHYMPPDPMGLDNPAVLAGVLGTVCAIVLAALLIRRQPVFAVCGGFFLLTVVPVLGVVEYSWVWAFDNYLYLPMVGLLLIPGWYLARSRRTPMHVPLMIAAVLIVALEAVRTREYLAVWRDTETLFGHMVHLEPRAYRARLNWGLALQDQGKKNEAITQIEEALRINPQYELAHMNLGDFLSQAGRADLAIAHYREALRIKPDLPAVHLRLAAALAAKGDRQEAAEHYRQVLRLKPDIVVAHLSLGNLLLEMGQLDEAVSSFERVIALKRDTPEAQNNLGVAMLKMGKPADAIPHFAEAIRIRSEMLSARRNLAATLAREGRTQEAVEQYREILRRVPGDPDAVAKLNALQNR